MTALERRLFNLEQSRTPGTYPALVVGGETVFNGDRGGGTFVIQPVGSGDQSALGRLLAEIASGIEPREDGEIPCSTPGNGPGVSEVG